MVKRQYSVLCIGAVALVFITAVACTYEEGGGGSGKTMPLQNPPLVRDRDERSLREAAEGSPQLAEEAGISAYVRTSNAIDLSLVRGQFRTIEAETNDYVIGSVPVPDHPELFDVHVYVHTDGWIVAYYMADEPTSKIVDVKAQTIHSTKLETVMAIIAGALGESVARLKYCDFRYPDATDILMVAEDESDGYFFTIELPSAYAYYEHSWAAYAQRDDTPTFTIDETQAHREWWGAEMSYGCIPSSRLLPAVSHTIAIDAQRDGYGVLVITYQKPH
jgi:hypothetical protein